MPASNGNGVSGAADLCPATSLHTQGKATALCQGDTPCRVGGGQPRHCPGAEGPGHLRCVLPSHTRHGAKGSDSRAFSRSLWSQGGMQCPVVGPCKTLRICPMLTAWMKAKGTRPQGTSNGQGCPAKLSPLGVVLEPGEGCALLSGTGGPVQVRPLALLCPHSKLHGRRCTPRHGFTRKQPILVAQSG